MFRRNPWIGIVLGAGFVPSVGCTATPEALRFVTPAQSMVAGTCSKGAVVERVGVADLPALAPTETTVALSGQFLTFYSDADCTRAVTSVTIPARRSEATFYFRSYAASAVSVTAEATGLRSASQTATYRHSVATQVVFVGAPPPVVAGAPISPALDVRIQDAYGNIVFDSSAEITLSLPREYAGTLSGTLRKAATNGRALFSGVILSTPTTGSYRLQASVDGLASHRSLAFNVNASSPAAPVAAESLRFATAPQSLIAGDCSGLTTIERVSAAGAPAPAASEAVVSLAGTFLSFYSDAACTRQVSSVTIATGRSEAGFHFRSYAASAIDLTASATGLGSAAQTQIFSPSVATQVVFVGAPAASESGATISPALDVRIQDAYGNIVTSSTATITIDLPAGYAGSLAGTLQKAATTGRALFGGVSVLTGAGGSYRLRASVPGLRSTLSLPFEVKAGASAAAEALVFRTAAQSLVAGSCSGVTTVERVTASGAPAPLREAASVSLSGVFLSFFADAACTQPVSAVTIPAEKSQASFHFRSYAASATDLSATSAGLRSATQAQIFAPSLATQVVFVGDPASCASGKPIAPALDVRIQDAYGNIALGATSQITLSLADDSASATLSGTLQKQAVTGRALFGDVAVIASKGGKYKLLASVSGLKSNASAPFEVSAPEGPLPTPGPSLPPVTVPIEGAPLRLSGVWANDGGDKVPREDVRLARGGARSVLNSVWNGSRIAVFGARNEVVAFNLVIEAATQAAPGVMVSFDRLTGPGGATISSVPVTGMGVYDWTRRNIENFYVRYLAIRGVSKMSYEGNYYDERHAPFKMRRPWSGAGVARPGSTWQDRPDHDKAYPDIAQPLELISSFDIAAGQSQSIWTDIYIPRTAPAGLYVGTVTVTEGAHVSYQIPVELTVRSFELPDVPSSKTMLVGGGSDIWHRYTGEKWPERGTANYAVGLRVDDRQQMMAHRHKISMIGGAEIGDRPADELIPHLSGSLFTAGGSPVTGVRGYDGPGVGVGTGVYSIGTYGSWQPVWGTSQAAIQSHTNAWETWFQANFPSVERFLYLIDESPNYAQTQQWAHWVRTNPGIGSRLPTMATAHLPSAIASMPSLTIPTSAGGIGITSVWETALSTLRQDPAKRYYAYNGSRPSGGSWCTEDDGVALRELAWGQYKKGIDRWFYWNANYYNDYQGGRGQTNVFQTAATFSGAFSHDPIYGETGWNHTNGDGVLFYPGTDRIFPSESLGLEGPLASLRLKHWRRGIQDVDYLALARAVDPAAVQAIVDKMVPKVLWEYGVDNVDDPSYVHTDISWSINPDDWEAARAQLAEIIERP